jgi:hypothetical protein
MTFLDRLILLATGLVAIYLLWRFYNHYLKSSKTRNIYYIASFAVLLVAGLLLIIFTYDALESPWVIIVAVLIPGGLAVGLTSDRFPKYERPYLIYAIIGLLAIAVTRFTGPSTLATVVLIIFHTSFGLTIFFLPIYAVTQNREVSGYLWVTVGGTLIGLGGIALAFLKTGRQLLFFSADFVFTILAPLLLLMALAFGWGFVKQISSET